MFIKIPFESTLEFKTNINEITKMSLEHDFNINDKVVLGNFYISGDYKIHEVSINKDSFNYTLPFEVELREDIKKDTLEFNIEDFSYEIIDNKNLKVNIEYSLSAEVEELFERIDENELESELAFIDNFLEEDNSEVTEEVDVIKLPELKEEVVEDEKTECEEEEKMERIIKEEEKTVMDTIKDSDDTFVTYHIHIVKESETIETICKMYNVQNSLINEYNNIGELMIGDKILIPKLDE